MPNWVVHMGITFLVFKCLKIKLNDIRLILIGSILPDIEALAYVFFLDYYKPIFFSYETFVWYFQTFHTPFICFFLSWAFGLLFSGKPIKNFLLIYSACVFHFLLDALQYHIGFHQILGYPFILDNLNFNLFFPDHLLFFILSIISFVLLIWAFIYHKEEMHFQTRYMKYSIFIFIFVFIFPVFTKELFYKNDYHHLNFFSNRFSYENKKMEIAISKVISLNPLKVKELNKVIQLNYQGPEKFKIGDEISYRGIYKNGQINITYIRKDYYHRKVWISILGVVFLFMIFLKTVLIKSLKKSCFFIFLIYLIL